jgi:Tol biopolymer transport system component
VTRLTHAPWPEFDPSWSPNGSRIAFNSNLTGDHVMYIAQADGSNVVDLSKVGEGWQVDRGRVLGNELVHHGSGRRRRDAASHLGRRRRDPAARLDVSFVSYATDA